MVEVGETVDVDQILVKGLVSRRHLSFFFDGCSRDYHCIYS